jgi:hypothetical protein
VLLIPLFKLLVCHKSPRKGTLAKATWRRRSLSRRRSRLNFGFLELTLYVGLSLVFRRPSSLPRLYFHVK